MRRLLAMSATLLASAALVVPGAAQTGSTPGQFASGFTPTNISFQPLNFTGTMKPTNVAQAVTPQGQSSKVFNIGSAFRSVTMPLYRSTAPTVPIVKPGRNNPLQPVDLPKARGPQKSG